MKRFYAILLPVLFLTTVSFAQSNFKPGYVVTSAGDTLRGTIDYKEWDRSPSSISFKDNNGTVRPSNEDNTKAFGVDGLEQFQMFKLSVSMDDVAVDKIKTQYDSTRLIATAFLRVLATGDHLSLYSYTDNIKTRYIVTEKNDGKPLELSYHLFINQANNNAITPINRFRIELTTIAERYGKNAPSLISQIQSADYDARYLIKIVNAINGESAKTLSTKSGSGTRLFIGVTLVGAKLTYTGNTDLAYNSKNKTNYLPQVNFGFDYLPNVVLRRFFLRAELNLSSGNIQTVSDNATKKFDMFTATLNPQMIYNFYSPAKANFYIGAGFACHFSSYGKEELTFVGVPNYTVNEQYSKLESTWFSLPLKAGVTLNKMLEIEAGYSPKIGAHVNKNGYADYTGSLSSFHIGINYLLKR